MCGTWYNRQQSVVEFSTQIDQKKRITLGLFQSYLKNRPGFAVGFAFVTINHGSFCGALSDRELLRAMPIHTVSDIHHAAAWPFVPSPSFREHLIHTPPPIKNHRNPKTTNNKTSLLLVEEQTSTSHSEHLTLIRATFTSYRYLKPSYVSDSHISSQLLSSTQF